MSAQTSQKTRLVYGGLLLLWLLVVAWQSVEHRRVRAAARAELITRAKDISSTLGLVIRSQRRFGGLISRERIESALASLIRPGELNAIALLNDSVEVVASAGPPIDLELKALVPSAEYWAAHTVALMNLVDLGTNITSEPEERLATIVISRSDMPGFPTNRPPGGPPPGPPLGPPPDDARNPNPTRDSDAGDTVNPRPPPPPEARFRPDPDAPDSASTNAPSRPRRGRRDGRFPFNRPFWMSEQEFKSLAQKQGVHSFVLQLSTRSLQEATAQDLWARLMISAFAGVSALGLGLAWRNLAHSADLEVRLARAAELNARLKEMNLAAAGLAHETRNPLNIIRGLAQLISRQPAGSPEVNVRATAIVAETDRVTAQLNEFINYSRPREVHWAAVDLAAVTQDVARALASDLEEHGVRLVLPPSLPSLRADEQLLRQALFNLLLNAIQAAHRDGTIEIVASPVEAGEFHLDIRDDGPGVPPEHRAEIFKPYFTTRAEGTGLGLAVVHQIVLAHGWDIECLANQPRGALFQLRHLKTPARS
ncbi:MAG: hypothetical protein IT580_03200 [Verrucomicrobiales bacterium]|nr:hypothetical protein [Verrucomicrobiales bacterium]